MAVQTVKNHPGLIVYTPYLSYITTTDATIIYSFGLFLACYSHYLAGEKLKDQTVSEAQYSNQNAERENSKKESQPVNGSKKSKKKIPMIDLLGNNDSYESRSRNAHLRDIYLDLAPLYCDDDEDFRDEEDSSGTSTHTCHTNYLFHSDRFIRDKY